MTSPEATPTWQARGTFFDGRSSRAHPARCWQEDGALLVYLDGAEGLAARSDLAAVVIEPALGQVRRVLKLAGGERFETDDLEAVAALERQLGRNRGLSLVSRLEGRWSLVLGCLALLIVASWAFAQFGLPAFARTAAGATPQVMLAALDRQTLAFLDRHLLSPSRLPSPTRARLKGEFSGLAREIGGAYPYRLAFRDSDEMGANAFALPDGTVVITDDLVKLARGDREILGVLAHEVGHVTHRHGARSIYQSVGLLMFVSLLTGDVTTASTVAGTFSLGLVQNGYSREMESEADGVAGAYLMRHYGTTKPLRDILSRLQGKHEDVPTLLSTHPGTKERLAHLKSFER